MKYIILFLFFCLAWSVQLTLAQTTTGGRFTIEVSAAGADTTGTGNLFIRNQSAVQENKTSNYRTARLDTLFAKSVAGYLWNRAADYTVRSWVDKGYIDSITNLLMRYSDTADALTPYLLKSQFRILSALDVDSSGSLDGDFLRLNKTTGKVEVTSFPTNILLDSAVNGIVVSNYSGVTLANGTLLWKQAADGLYTSLTGSYANPSWISSLAWSKLTGVPSTFTPSAHTHDLADLTQSGATTGQVPQWNGSAWAPATVSGGGSFDLYSARLGAWEYWNEFITPLANTTSGGNDLVINATGTGTGVGAPTPPSANRPGILQLQTGSTATGRTTLYTTSILNTFALGGGAATLATDVTVPTLSTSTERYACLFGFFDANTMNQTDGVYFLYDEGGVSTGSAASANWQCVTASNSSRTFTTTSTAVSTSAYQRLQIEVNAAGTSVDFKIDGVTVATHTTNIPTGTSRVMTYGYQLIKSIGTSGRFLFTDWFYAKINFTTSR